MMRPSSPASYYNNLRDSLFYKYHNPTEGKDDTFEYLVTDIRKKTINPHLYGLKAELNFYDKYGTDYGLTLARDIGDKRDFAGTYNGKSCRIDVTTNLDVKKFSDYEPFQNNKMSYFIALMNRKTDELIDFIDVNFEFCQYCNSKRYEVLILGPEKIDNEGTPYYGINEVSLVRVCTYDPDGHSKLVDCVVSPGTFNFSELSDNLEYERLHTDYEKLNKRSQSQFDKHLEQQIERHATENVKYFRKYFDKRIFAIGSPTYFITNPMNGDGYKGIRLYWISPLINQFLEFEMETDLSEI